MRPVTRRDFIAVLGISAAVWPLSAHTQQLKRPLVGFLNGAPRNSLFYEKLLPPFHRGLADAGYVEGQNVAIEYRFAEGQVDRLPALIADLVNRNIAVLVASTNAAALAAKAATTTIPIVFVIGGDPVKLGLVESFSRPAGNVTGISFFSTQLEAKRLGLLHELVPRATLIAVLTNPGQPAAAAQEEEVATAARALGLEVHVVHASSEEDLDSAFTTCIQMGAGGLLVAADATFYSRYKKIVALAARHAIPAIYEWRDFVLAGGLASYGTSLAEAFRQAGVYTGKIVDGAKVTDLPALQTTKFEFVINLKTAKALGIDVPPMLSARADDVIE
jgi:putative tryptophan/tyrosine transport system substrate-binding protein